MPAEHEHPRSRRGHAGGQRPAPRVDRCDVDGIVTAIELYGCYDDDELFDLLESSFGAVQTQLGNAAPPAFLSLLKARLRANRSSESAGAAQPPIGAASPAASACQTPHGRRGDGGVRSSAPVRAPQPPLAHPNVRSAAQRRRSRTRLSHGAAPNASKRARRSWISSCSRRSRRAARSAAAGVELVCLHRSSAGDTLLCPT